MTRAEKRFLDFLSGRSGSFFDHLFRAIQAADSVNRDRLSFGFPHEVEVVRRWQEEPGYAARLEREK